MKLFLLALALALPQFEGYQPIFEIDCKQDVCEYIIKNN